MPSISLREANAAEIAAVYANDAEHIVGTVDGETVAYIGFKRIGEHLWGLYHPFCPAHPSVWHRLFYAFRRQLRAKGEPVYVLARDADASRVLALLGLKPTGSFSFDKEIWIWMPAHYF